MADFLSRSYFLAVSETIKTKHRLNRKMHVLIRSPFRPGVMVTLSDIIHAIRTNPGIVCNILPPQDKQLDKDVEIESLGLITEVPSFRPAMNVVDENHSDTENLSLMGSTIFRKLSNHITFSNIVKYQNSDEVISKLKSNTIIILFSRTKHLSYVTSIYVILDWMNED